MTCNQRWQGVAEQTGKLCIPLLVALLILAVLLLAICSAKWPAKSCRCNTLARGTDLIFANDNFSVGCCSYLAAILLQRVPLLMVVWASFW